MDSRMRESTVHPPADLPALPPAPWVLCGADGTAVHLPAEAWEVLGRALEAFDHGAAVTLVPHERTLTTQEAADLLGVSRPTVVRLLDQGAIPYDQPGSHRRLKLSDVLAHQRRCHHEDPAPD
ncbi:excisionase family DNA-binding protein [Klenkia sp. LSe6-5]|uniref:Excisionase family DNA-binding protein n=1 Tax=Klenkia sesuvii TaxID=3103137 RepID=A0ABU8DUZ7_9ACTN